MSSALLHAFIDHFEGHDPTSFNPQTLLKALADLPDPRAKRGIRHPLAHILVIMICAVIAGAKTIVEIAEWARDAASEQLAIYGIGAPHATTIARVFQRLDTQEFEFRLSNWAQNLTSSTAIAVDGKEVRGAKNAGEDRVHLLAAIDQSTGAVCAQVPVGTKTNEITQFSTLLDHFLDLKGKVITADALHTQTAHARYLQERGAYYVFTVKGNQPSLHNEMRQLPWDHVPEGHRSVETKNGRRTIRIIKCVTVTRGISFPHAAQALQITRKSRPIGSTKWHTETVHALTSLPTHQATPEDIGGLIRGHWGIENGLHWRRDVTWNEDKSQVRKGNAPQVMAILRNIAITLLRHCGHRNLARATRKLRHQPATVLALVGLARVS